MGKDIIIIKDGSDAYPVLHIRGTKTDNAVRDVPIPAELYERIKDTPKFSYIAPNQAGNKHTENSFKRAINSLRRGREFEPLIVHHIKSLEISTVSRLFAFNHKSNVNLYLVQKFFPSSFSFLSTLSDFSVIM